METLRRVLKDRDLRMKIVYVLGLLVIFRLAAALPIPGVDPARLASFFEGNQLFGLLNVFTGGALDNLSIMMLGVAPYITGSIIMQLLTMVFPSLKAMHQEEGEAGRKKFAQYSRLLALPLAVLQGFGLLSLLANQGVIEPLSVIGLTTNIIVITAGAMFLMWIGELITQYGVGNGISLLIFAGIVSALPTSLRQIVIAYDPSQLPTLIGFLVVAAVIVGGVVFVTQGERPIPISYAKRVRGMKLYGGSSSYLPLRVNQAGVIPIIFALSLLLFPQMIVQFFSGSASPVVAKIVSALGIFSTNLWIYGSAYFVLVFLFTYFYTAVTFDPDQIATNLQKSGGFIPGMRPGKSTAEYLGQVINRITLFGGFFLGLIAVLPIILQGFTGAAFLTIGGTALLIVVSVVIETVKQIQAQLTLREYE